MKIIASIAALVIATSAYSQSTNLTAAVTKFSRSQVASNEAWLTLTAFKPVSTNLTAKVSVALATNLIEAASVEDFQGRVTSDPDLAGQKWVVTNIVKITTYKVFFDGSERAFEQRESLWSSAPLRMREVRPKKREWEVISQ